MPEIMKRTRAKSMWVEVEREDKYGERKPQKVKQHITISGGLHSGKEMEQLAKEQAEAYGVSEDKIHIETYKNGESPIEVNPYHRGKAHNWSKRVSEATETTVRERPQRVRTTFGGVDLPKTPEEVQRVIDEFEERKRLMRGT